MKTLRRLLPRLAVIGMSLFAGSASAALITSRAALGGNDYIDWAQLGSSFTNVTDPANVTSNLGLSATLNNPNGAIQRRNQGSGSWNGNFAAGDALVFTNNTPGPLVIDFAAPVFGGGAQIQRDTFGEFTWLIQAYDAGNVLLESYSGAGNSTTAGDNSAVFIGISRGTADIDRIEFNVTLNSDFAINRLSLVTASVPEPGTLALLGLGLAGLAASRRRKQ